MSVDEDEITRKLGVFLSLGHDAGVQGGHKWWRLGSNKKDVQEHPDAVPINEQIGVDAETMKRAIGLKWTGQFLKPTKISHGFIYREYSKSNFVSICPEGGTSDTPATGTIIQRDSTEATQIQTLIEVRDRQQQRDKNNSGGRQPPIERGEYTARSESTPTPTTTTSSTPCNAAKHAKKYFS